MRVAGERAIYGILSEDSGLDALIDGRVYANEVVPAGVTRPYVEYQLISGVPLVSITGKTGLAEKRFTVHAVADSFAACVSVSNALRSACQDYTGVVNSETVRRATVEDGPSSQQLELEGGQGRIHVQQFDVILWVDE